MKHPRIAYVTLWFPKPSETFIFREVKTMESMGLPVKVFTLYAPLKDNLSPEMRDFIVSESLGIRSIFAVLHALCVILLSRPRKVLRLLKRGPLNGWRSLEGLGENLWGFCCGVYLAKRFVQARIQHIHAPWAGGPATAAWVASSLTGIPFSFAGRAGDIYPPEGALSQKIADAAFVRVNYAANVPYLQSFSTDHSHKIKLIYNALSLTPKEAFSHKKGAATKILAAGRFVEKKGFEYLLEACAILAQNGIDFMLTFAGDGALASKLKMKTTQLGLDEHVCFEGFLSHDELSRLMFCSDILVMPCVVDSRGDRDGIPNVIMEAYVHGLPVVASDVAGIKEVVKNNESGLLTPPKDSAALANALQVLATDEAFAQNLAEYGKALVLDMFSPQKNCGELIRLFTENSLD